MWKQHWINSTVCVSELTEVLVHFNFPRTVIEY